MSMLCKSHHRKVFRIEPVLCGFLIHRKTCLLLSYQCQDRGKKEAGEGTTREGATFGVNAVVKED